MGYFLLITRYFSASSVFADDDDDDDDDGDVIHAVYVVLYIEL